MSMFYLALACNAYGILRIIFNLCACRYCGLVCVQISRRSWSGNSTAERTLRRAMEANEQLKVTVPFHVEDESLLDCAAQI